MGASPKPRDIIVDSQLLAINFEDVHLLQKITMLPHPKEENLLRFKERYNISLSTPELSQEFKNKNSSLYKYTQSMINFEVNRMSALMEEENIREMMAEILSQQQKHAGDSFKKKLQHLRTKNILRHKGEHLADDMKVLPEKSRLNVYQASALSEYLIQAAKSRDLSFYLQYANKTLSAATIQQLVEDRYQKTAANLAQIDSLLNSNNLTPQQREDYLDLQARIFRRIELTDPVTLLKNVPHLNLDDSVRCEQHLRNMSVQEEILAPDIKQMLLKPIPVKQVTDHSEKQSIPELMKTKCNILQQLLNLELEKLIEKNEDVLVKMYPQMSALQDQLYQVETQSADASISEINQLATGLKAQADPSMMEFHGLSQILANYLTAQKDDTLTPTKESGEEFKYGG